MWKDAKKELPKTFERRNDSLSGLDSLMEETYLVAFNDCGRYGLCLARYVYDDIADENRWLSDKIYRTTEVLYWVPIKTIQQYTDFEEELKPLRIANERQCATIKRLLKEKNDFLNLLKERQKAALEACTGYVVNDHTARYVRIRHPHCNCRDKTLVVDLANLPLFDNRDGYAWSVSISRRTGELIEMGGHNQMDSAGAPATVLAEIYKNADGTETEVPYKESGD